MKCSKNFPKVTPEQYARARDTLQSRNYPTLAPKVQRDIPWLIRELKKYNAYLYEHHFIDCDLNMNTDNPISEYIKLRSDE